MAEIEKKVPTVTDDMQKSLSAKHQIGVLSRNPTPETSATTSTPSADSSTTSAGKADKK
jgi:hypothetical protein